jgi:hypothetical protein
MKIDALYFILGMFIMFFVIYIIYPVPRVIIRKHNDKYYENNDQCFECNKINCIHRNVD